MTDQPNLPDQILAAIAELRAENRAGMTDIRRAIARDAAENRADAAAIRADVTALAARVESLFDDLADFRGEQIAHVRDHPGSAA